MGTIKLKCTAQEDFILVKKEKTEQTTESLDYIPGNIFRGIVAAFLFKNKSESKNEKINEIIFSDKVQFGDAHLIINDKRSYKVPASFYYKKEDQTKNIILNFHKTDTSEKIKQKRSGYIIANDNDYYIDTVNYGGRMKSAREGKNRSSKKEGLFFYQYIKKGQEFAFEINCTSIDKKDKEEIRDALTNSTKRIGKARGSEFGGRIKIEVLNSDTTLFNNDSNSFNKNESDSNYLYAASNLCILNEYGEFTATPSIKQLTGLEDTSIEIDWQNTQLWFRKFMPYNGFRKNWDAERLIIEKGSVFVLKNTENINNDFKTLVGCFISEGYGKLLINPKILTDKNIELKKYVPKSKQGKENDKENDTTPDTKLINYLITKFDKNELKEDIQKEVNIFLDTKKFNDKISSSQWSRIYKESSNPKFNKASSNEKIDEIDALIFNLLFNDDKGICTSGNGNPWTIKDIEQLKGFLKINTEKNKQLFALRILSKKMYTNKKQPSHEL